MDRRTFLIRCAALSAGGVLAATLPSWAQRALEEKTLRFDSDLYRRFTDPASTDRPFVRWWWNGDRVKADELVREVPVALSSEANYVVAHPAESITRMLPTELDLSELTRDITLPDSVDAPIAAGDELGEMTVSYNGTVYGTVKLLALSDVSASWLLVAKRDVADFFSRTAVRIVLVVLVLLILAFLFLRGNGRGRRYGKRSSGRAAPAGYRGRRR